MTEILRRRCLPWVAGVLVLTAPSVVWAEPAISQTLTLNPGWNAISFAVRPAEPDLSAIFHGIEVESVWAYDNVAGSPDFIREVSEEALARAGWRSWVPTNRVESFQNDLFALQANRAYLIKFNGATPVPVTLTGRPTLRPTPWQPDAFNFRALPVDMALPPSFLNFFRPSAAHYSTAAGLTAIYRLNAAGVWARVAPADLMRPGEACWIYCKGSSDYGGPLKVSLEFGDGLDFGAALDEQRLTVRNLGSAAMNVTVRNLNPVTPNPLAYAEWTAGGALTWPELPLPLVWPVAASAERTERISARRANLTTDRYESILEITDGQGTRVLAPVSLDRAGEVTTASGAGAGGGLRVRVLGSDPETEAISHAGLWVGAATIGAVSEVHSGPLTTNESMGYTLQTSTNTTTGAVTTERIPNGVVRTNVSPLPTPTGSEFRLRLLVHVDAAGQARLLKEVIQMWRNGTTTNDANGVAVVDRPGEYVLLTDDSRVGDFTGVTSRDGVEVGRRLSSAGFDFVENELPLSGFLAATCVVRGTNGISGTFARNPFKHRYHPDHATGRDIRRVIELELAGSAPTNAPPGYGERVLDGTYRETVSGLHRNDIVVRGSFRLTRIATAAVLNPQP